MAPDRETMMGEGQRIDLDLDGLVARYGRKLAQAELDAEIASQRADRAERRAADLVGRVSALERLLESQEDDDHEEPTA